MTGKGICEVAGYWRDTVRDISIDSGLCIWYFVLSFLFGTSVLLSSAQWVLVLHARVVNGSGCRVTWKRAE